MSTHGVNHNNNTQSAPPTQQQDFNQQSKRVSERQAGDFAERMAKEKRSKEKAAGENKEKAAGENKGKITGENKEQSLESLLAERNKHSKEAIKGRQERGSRDEENSDNKFRDPGTEQIAVNTPQNQIKADTQLREIQQINSVKEVDAALQKLADQIQVSSKDAINGAEVRITLKDSVLPGTEIRIQRQGGELTVVMNTSSAEAGNFLAQHEASLQKMLAERFSNDKVQVNINMSGGDNQDSDGRSRNQYVAEDNDQGSSSSNDRA